MAQDASCDSIVAALGTHWMTAAQLGRQTGAPVEAVRRCMEAAVAAGQAQTPRGVYRNTMWRRREDAHHSS